MMDTLLNSRPNDGIYSVYVGSTVIDGHRKLVRSGLTRKEVLLVAEQLASDSRFAGQVVTVFEGKRWIATRVCGQRADNVTARYAG